MSQALLQVRDLSLSVEVGGRRCAVLHQLSFTVARGECLGIVGESGSGKSLLLAALMGLLPGGARLEAGEIFLEGRNLRALPERAMAELRGRSLAWVFQEPQSALDPLYRVDRQLAEVLRERGGHARKEALALARQRLQAVGILRPEAYPHELSGGMRQRVVIALATALEPAVLLADEPTTALDARIQAQVLALLREAKKRQALALIFVSHDWRVVASMADRIAVLYAGHWLEEGPTALLSQRPLHPYTRALLAARWPEETDHPPVPIPGTAPALGEDLGGCIFHARCAHANELCRKEQPRLRELAGAGSQRVACHRAEELTTP